MALSSDQLADMQGDLGITDDETVFTDEELERLFTRAQEIYPLAVYFGFRQLMAQANKLRDYAQAMTKESLSQVRRQLYESMVLWKEEARIASNQLRIVGGLSVPPRVKDEPTTDLGRSNVPDALDHILDH